MLYITLAVVFLIVLALAGVGRLLAQTDDGKSGSLALAVFMAFLLVVTTIGFSATTVSARSVGIQTSFGKYVDTLDNGFHWTTPWSGVEEFSTLAQPLTVKDQAVSFAGTRVKDANGVETVSGSGGSGDFDGQILWAIDPSGKGAEKLWEKYRSYENVRDNLVDKAFREAGRVQIGKFNPVEAKDGSNLRPINEAVLADLKETLAPRGIVVDTVTITDIALGESAQNSLNRIVEANANTERAKSEKERASIDAETQGIRDASGLNTPTAIQRYCLEVTNSWDTAKNGPLPAGWSCASSAPFVVTP